MTAIEERAIEIGKMFGMVERVELEKKDELLSQEKEKSRKLMEIRERRERRHNKLRTALNMHKKGFDYTMIAELVEMDLNYLQRFFHRIGA